MTNDQGFYTKKEIAALYQVHPHTIRAYFELIGIKKRSLINQKEWQKFKEHYGEPF